MIRTLKITFLTGLSVSFSILCYSQGTGLDFDERSYRQIPEEEKPLGFGENLPSSSTLRKYTPEVAHQGAFGTCVGWSTTYYASTIEFARLSQIENSKLITALAFDPYFTFLNITKESDYFSCSEGTLITNAANHLKAKGVKRFNYNTLECGARIDLSNKVENSPIKFTDFRRLTDSKLSSEENISSVKQALADGHPVVIGMALPKSFYNTDSSGLFKPEPSEKQFVADYGGHAMAVIGYDDNRFGGTFEIINSWGSDWGDNGFVYVKYDDFNSYTRMAVRFETELVPLKNDKGCVFGDCSSGYGRMIYEDGSIYEGNFINNERSGYGMLIWKDDLSSFGGEWESSKRHGKGALRNSKGSIQQGYWKNDEFVQNEIVINKVLHASLTDNIVENIKFLNPKEVAELLKDKACVDTLMTKFKPGCIYGDCQNGTGVLLAQNYIYFGTFQSGLRHGYGEMRWTGESWGNAYIGNSEANTRTGIGAYFWPNGNKYYGEWKNGAREGLGSFFNVNGEIQAGKFENNTFVSEGMGFGAINVGTVLEEPKAVPVIVEDKSTSAPAPTSVNLKKKKKNKK